MSQSAAVVDATEGHSEGIVAVAHEHGFDTVDSAAHAAYRQFVASHGRLVVAMEHDVVVGFGGAIDVDGTRLVTDLFLLSGHQGRGLGGAMLHRLVDDTDRRMTFSSAHERALPTYRRVGMQPVWALQYWSGRAPAPAPVHQVVEVPRGQWQGDRPDLADFWTANGGRLIHVLDDDRVVGWATVVPPARDASPWTISRVWSQGAHDRAMLDALSVVPVGELVHVCVPDRSAARSFLSGLGFEAIDQDICCATDGVDLPIELAAVHPGLG